MAGAVAMAAVIEDFEATQPCKKSRKDDDPPPTRTITNYFAPLTKTVEKSFSPPRSNNIMDYFRKTSPAQEKANSQKSQLQSAESVDHQEVSVKSPRTPKQKQTRKVKEQNKIQKENQEVLADCAVLESPNETLIKDGGGLSLLGSDTAALLSQISSDICLEDESLSKKNATKTCANERKVKDVSQNNKSKNLGHTCQDGDSLGSDHATSGQDKGKTKKPVVRKSRKAKVSQSESCNMEPEQSSHDANLKVSVDETPMLNPSTVTVSFEEFLQSQRQENATDLEPDKCGAEPSNEANSCKDVSDVVHSAPQVSPRTLTVKVEVHPISPEHEASLSPKLKVASIFSRNKKEGSIKDANTLSSSSSSNPQVTADILPDLKRKSNVVLHEEDLELDVVESSTTLKCTQEERKQFMNAFKQPTLDGSKSKPSKVLGKVKQEKAPETLEKEPEEKNDESKSDLASSEPSAEHNGNKSDGKKRGRRSLKKKLIDKDEAVQDSSEKNEELPVSTEVDKSDSVNNSNKQTVKEVRRSTREQTRRQTASVPEINRSPRKTRGQKTAEKSESEKSKTESQDDPAVASTPKPHKSKKSVYRAEMISTPDQKGSPIRMKFTRVLPSSATKTGDFHISSPLSKTESNSLKRRKQAKRLVQKAKAIQHSKQMAAAEAPPVRRSSRTKEAVKMNYCEDEDSVVFLEDSLSNPAPQKSDKSDKKLRSLNEVLGKNTPPVKASKNAAGSKVAPMFLERKAPKPSAVISIFDDSSREGSENSQDDEKFRAKREFLKSGLPESFKKQIAKTAANRETYTQACASFQPVVHVQQKPPDCAMWNLPWPENRFLSHLKEFYQLASLPVVSIETGNTTVPAIRTPREKVSGWQELFTESVQQHLLQEITASNPSFPVQRFFARFLKRQKDYLLQNTTADAECGSKTPATSTESVGGKRKRVDDGEKTGKLAKKQKSRHVEEEPIVIDDDSPSSERGGTTACTESVASTRGRRRRPVRHKQVEQECKPKVLNPPKKMECDSPIIIDSPSSENSCAGEGAMEDVLWPEKYQPQHSSDVIGNTASVRKLHSWLKEWKLRADREERRKQQEKKQENDSNDSWLEGESSEGLEDGEDVLCNTLLITGPTGVGKTAAVYACAQELGFKVFEVNCSSQRSGRQILSQLKEATQSHQVDIQGVNAHKPSFFNSYTSSSAGKIGSSPRKVNSPRRVVSSPRKPPQSPRGAKRKGSLAPTSLASLFKMSGSQDKKTVCPRKSGSVRQAGPKSQEPLMSASDNNSTPEEQGKRTATSLILFEEVDVIFDDDSGFLAAIKTFMTTTKRPVILTTSDPTFSAMFDGYFDEIHFKVPSVVNVASYLQLLCLAENVRTDAEDLACLLCWNGCDVRQSLLHLQFWARSGGGRHVPLPILPSGTTGCGVKTENVTVENVSGTLPPPCHTGCTESLLGLLNIQQEKAIEDLLKCEPSAEEKMRCWGLLSEAKSGGVNLLYSNMEALLPLPVCALPGLTLRTQPVSNPEPQSELSDRQEENTEDMSPLKMSSRMRRKKQLCLDNRNVLQSDSESDDDFLSLPKSISETKPVHVQDSVAASVRMRRIELSDDERRRSKPVSQCLNSLADHLDDMSFLDSSLHYRTPQAEGTCRPQDFTWTGAEVKSGMTDEVRQECGDRLGGFDSLEIHAVLGSLSFWKSKARITTAWNAAQELNEELRNETVKELTLPVSSHRQRFNLIPSTPGDPRVMETRKEVMSTVLTSRSFSTLGHRAAAALDYLPFLRTICRSEKLKEQGKVKRRFMHYLEGIHIDIPKSTIQQLASDFP